MAYHSVCFFFGEAALQKEAERERETDREREKEKSFAGTSLTGHNEQGWVRVTLRTYELAAAAWSPVWGARSPSSC